MHLACQPVRTSTFRTSSALTRRDCPWQVIAFLAHLAEARGERGPWLIVAPASLLPNWEAELAAWAPAIAVLAYKGSAQTREALFTSQVGPACCPICVSKDAPQAQLT